MGKCTVHMKKRIDEGNSRNIFLTMARFFHGETYFTWKSKTRVTSWEFKPTCYEFKSTSYEFKFMSYEFKFTSYEFKSRVTSSYSRVRTLNHELQD